MVLQCPFRACLGTYCGGGAVLDARRCLQARHLLVKLVVTHAVGRRIGQWCGRHGWGVPRLACAPRNRRSAQRAAGMRWMAPELGRITLSCSSATSQVCLWRRCSDLRSRCAGREGSLQSRERAPIRPHFLMILRAPTFVVMQDAVRRGPLASSGAAAGGPPAEARWFGASSPSCTPGPCRCTPSSGISQPHHAGGPHCAG